MKNHEHAEKKPRHLVERSTHSFDANAISAYLAEKEEAGWELVTVIGDTTFVFKAAS